MYQVIVGEHGGVVWSKEDGAIRLSESDLWGETRLGAPIAGGVWDRVQGQRTRREGGELRQNSEAGEERGEQGHSEGGNREDEGDDDVAADGGSNAPERGETKQRDGVRGDDVDSGEQGHDWMDPEWYVGQDVEEVNEMWEKDKVAGRWTGRRATGGNSRTKVRNYMGGGGRHSRGSSGETERVATRGDMDEGEGSGAAMEGGCVDDACTAEGAGEEADRGAATVVPAAPAARAALDAQAQSAATAASQPPTASAAPAAPPAAPTANTLITARALPAARATTAASSPAVRASPAARASTATTAASAASQPSAALPAAPAAYAASRAPAAPAAPAVSKRKRRDRVTVSVSVGYVEIEGKGELVGRGTGRIHVVRLAEVVAGVRRTSKKRRGGRIDVGAAGVNGEESCFPKGEEKQGPETDSGRDTDAATADSGENEVRRRNMRECEDAMMEDTASRRGYAPTAAWDEGNMIQAMARMKNPTIAWRFGDG